MVSLFVVLRAQCTEIQLMWAGVSQDCESSKELIFLFYFYFFLLFYFILFCLLAFLGPFPRHMEVPRLGV